MSTPATIRARAARIIVQVTDHGRSLDALLDERIDAPQERGLLRALCYGTVRWYIRLQAILEHMASRPLDSMQAEIRALTLVGLFQLIYTDIAPHAAVAETVEAANVLKHPRLKGFINAILRRWLRESQVVVAQVDTQLTLRTAHPEWLVTQLQRDWPEDATDILTANNTHPPFWLRVNVRHTTRDAYRERLQQAGIMATASPYAPEALLLSQAVDVHALPGFEGGVVSVQDAAAQLAAHFLAPPPGGRVLDACAAPGGKTGHLLELNPNLSVVAIDHSAQRLRQLHANLTRLQLAATIIEDDAGMPDAWWDRQPFDAILLDAPCSATGVIRRHPDIKLLRRNTDIHALAQRQMAMLTQLWPLLKTQGHLLYASCSVLRAENAEMLAAFLKAHPDAIDVTASRATALGLPPQAAGPGYAIATGQANMDGFYFACLRKT